MNPWLESLELVQSSLPKLLSASLLTLELVFLSLILASILAVPVALGQMSRNKFTWSLANGYVFFFRGTPLLIQIFLLYFGSGQFYQFFESIGLWQFLKEPFICAVIAFTLNSAAYLGEILKGGIKAIPPGEIEACQSLGMSRSLMLRRILLPRALRIILPAYGNEVVLLIKASSLVSTITLVDLMGMTRILVAETFAPLELFLTAGAIYLVMIYILTLVIKQLERYGNRHLILANE